jgi:hypothetical protein
MGRSFVSRRQHFLAAMLVALASCFSYCDSFQESGSQQHDSRLSDAPFCSGDNAAQPVVLYRSSAEGTGRCLERGDLTRAFDVYAVKDVMSSVPLVGLPVWFWGAVTHVCDRARHARSGVQLA